MSDSVLNSTLDAIVWVRTLVATLIAGAVLAQFLAPFLYPSSKYKAWLPASVYAAILLGLYFVPQEMSAAFARAAAVCTAGFVSYVTAEYRRGPTVVYLIVTFYALRTVANAIRGAVFAVLYDRYFVTALTNEQRQIAYIWCAVIEMGVFLLLLLLASSVIRHVYQDKTERLSVTECFLLIAPSAVAITADLMVGNLRLRALDYLQDSVFIEGNVCVLELVAFFSILATTALFSQVRRARAEKERRELLSSQLQDMRAYIGDMENLYAKMRSFRHDMAGHLQTLDALENAGDTSAAISYARSGLNGLISVLPGVESGNPVTDVILSRIGQLAEAEGVAFESAFHWPKDNAPDAFDVAVVIHNAGANALRATRETPDPFIRIRSICHRGSLLIEVENSCLLCPSIDPVTQLPLRADGSAGTGLRNIRSAAEKYGGTVRCICANSVFRLSVLIPPPHNANSLLHNKDV